MVFLKLIHDTCGGLQKSNLLYCEIYSPQNPKLIFNLINIIKFNNKISTNKANKNFKYCVSQVKSYKSGTPKIRTWLDREL